MLNQHTYFFHICIIYTCIYIYTILLRVLMWIRVYMKYNDVFCRFFSFVWIFNLNLEGHVCVMHMISFARVRISNMLWRVHINYHIFFQCCLMFLIDSNKKLLSSIVVCAHLLLYLSCHSVHTHTKSSYITFLFVDRLAPLLCWLLWCFK